MADRSRLGQRNSRELRFSSATYSLDTIKKAAYRLSDRCSFEFDVTANDITCRLFFEVAADPESVVVIENEFRNEVLDQDLRQTIADETAASRNAILAYAFSRTGLQGGDEV